MALQFFIGDAFAAVELIETLLDGGEEVHTVRDFVQQSVIGKLANRVEHKFFLGHDQSMNVLLPESKPGGVILPYCPAPFAVICTTARTGLPSV